MTTSLSRLAGSLRRSINRTRHGIVGVVLTLVSAGAAGAGEALLFDRLPESIRKAGVLRMVGDSFAPYRIVGSDGKTITGIDTDLARALEPLLGVRIEQVTVSNLPAVLAGIDTGRYDLTTGPLLSTREREMRYDIVTWLLSKPAFLLPVAGGRKTSRLEELCGLRVSFAAGSISEVYLNRVTERCVSMSLPAAQPVPLQDQNAAVLAIQSGRADAATSQLAVGLYLQQQNPGRYHIQTDQTDALGILNLGFVMKKESGLAPVLLEAMQRLFASGEYVRILTKSGLEQAKAPAPILNPSSK